MSTGTPPYANTPTLINNTIVQNSCTSPLSSAVGGGLMVASEDSVIGKNNIVYDNYSTNDPNICGTALFTYSCVAGGLSGLGNIAEDPLFVDPWNDDFHLQSFEGSYHGGAWLPDPEHSPCIDAGDPSSAFSNEPQPNGECINMGAYGNTDEASLSMITSVALDKEEIPTDFALYGAYPNPFNPSTTIRFDLPEACVVKLEVFDIKGRSVGMSGSGATHSIGQTSPTMEYLSAGTHEITFDGMGLSSGIYFYRIELNRMSGSGAPKGQATSQRDRPTMTVGKMVLMK